MLIFIHVCNVNNQRKFFRTKKKEYLNILKSNKYAGQHAGLIKYACVGWL